MCLVRPSSRSLAVGVALAFAASGAAAVETITLRSGQVGGLPGIPTQIDDIVTFGSTVPTGPLSPNPFTAADFNASAANPAIVITSFSSWLSSLSFDPQARWIGTGLYNADPFQPNLGAPSSALYRVPFTVTTTGITSATLSIAWACDDALGDQIWGGANPIGGYLRDPNGNVTILNPVVGGSYALETLVTNLNITGAIDTGLNELFLYQRDQGSGISGLIFGAEMRIVPTPGPAALAGLATLIAASRRRRRAG